MIEKDYLLRWLRAFFEGLRKLMDKSYTNGELIRKGIDGMYQDFFEINRKQILDSESDFLIDSLFDYNNNENSRKEKISALCQLMELDLKLEEDQKIKSILNLKILFLNDILINKYGFLRLNFK